PSMRRLLTADVALRSAVMALLLERRRAMEARLEALLLEGGEARLVGFLLDAVARGGQKHERGEVVDGGFTHRDLALVIGSTRAPVTLLLGKLRRAELIDFDRRRLVIRDRDGLARRGAEP